MNTAVLIHRWDGNPGADWYPWLKKELEMKNFKVIVPSMPNTTEPKIEEWVSHLKKIVPNPDKNTYFIGHSMGCQTIMRYLETLPHVKVGGIIFVAGWFYLKNLENDEVEQIAKPWLTTPIALSKIEGITNKITVFLSTNDPYNYTKENGEKFKNGLNAKIIIEKNKGHFTANDGIIEIKEVLTEIKEMIIK